LQRQQQISIIVPSPPKRNLKKFASENRILRGTKEQFIPIFLQKSYRSDL